MPQRPLRVLHTPWNIAGQSACLAAAERAIGLDSRCVVLFETGKGFPADEAYAASETDLARIEIARWRLLWRAALQADVISYSFGRSILMPNAYPDLSDLRTLPLTRWPRRLYARFVWMRDVALLKQLGKTIIVTWQGDDARQGDWLGANGRAEIAAEAGYYTPATDSWKRRIIARFGRYADRQHFTNPDLGHVLPADARFLPYASFDPAGVTPVPPGRASTAAPLVIAHAPSHRGVKGTRFVLDAVDRLRAEGLPLELRLIEGLDRAEAMRRYAEADVIIDQLIIGWYGGLAVEAMSLGKPVIARLRREDLRFVPPEMAAQLPVISAGPGDLAEVLRRLCAMDPAELRAIGEAGRRFAERWHDPASVARTIAGDYRTAP
jgi:hypothetical protein